MTAMLIEVSVSVTVKKMFKERIWKKKGKKERTKK